MGKARAEQPPGDTAPGTLQMACRTEGVVGAHGDRGGRPPPDNQEQGTRTFHALPSGNETFGLRRHRP